MRFRPWLATFRAAFALSFIVACFTFTANNRCLASPQDNEAETNAGESSETDENGFKVAEPLPVTRIVMFNSGLSQIVHEGKIDGSRKVDMRFSEHDVDDVLKSLVFDDQDGGIVRSVEYNPAPDNQDVAASNLGPAMTLAQTLQKYRGETVVIKTADNEIKGSILSVENRQTGDAFVETLTIVNDSGFVSLPLNDFQSINFENEKIREEFKMAMSGLQKTRLANAKLITLMFEGDGERDIRYSYNVDSPIWRMTYRLDLKKENSSLQGWAHIDNVTGVDWKEIQLDLRSGRPQSFHADLFAPVLAERMGVPLNIFDIPADKTLITKNSTRGSAKGGGFGSGGGSFGGFGGGGFGGGGERVGGGSRPFDINSAIRAAGTTGRSNKMVQFALKDSVSIGAGRSAMIPVLKEELPVKLFSMFTISESDNDGQPTTDGPSAVLVAQIQNKSTTPIIPGPTTLYQQGDFVGDSAMTRIEVDQTEELVYGNDLAVSLKVVNKPSKTKHDDVRISETGQVKISRTYTYSNVYMFSNEDSIARKFLLKAPLQQTDVTPAPIRKLGDLGVYTLDCAPRSFVKLEIIQKHSDVELSSLRSITDTDLALWKRDQAIIAADLQTRLDLLFEARNQVKNISRERSSITNQISNIEREQNRVTQLIKVLKEGSPVLENYLKKLEDTESELATAREALKAVTTRANKAAEELEKLE